MTGRTLKEWRTEWREKNREQYLQTRRCLYVKHREENGEKQKEHYRRNSEWLNEPIVCECDRTISRQHLNHHKKTNIHIEIMSEKKDDMDLNT